MSRPRQIVWLTCADDLRSHAVLLETLAWPTGPMADGVPAIGGHRIMLMPSVLAGPPGPRCPNCAASVPADAEDRTSEGRLLTLAYELAPHAFAHPPHSPHDQAALAGYAIGRAAHALALVGRSPRRRWWPFGAARRRGDESG